MNIGWITLDINILNDTKIKLIRKFPDGDKLMVLWIGLLCLAMKSDLSGYIYITDGIPYTPTDLAVEFEIDLTNVDIVIYKKHKEYRYPYPIKYYPYPYDWLYDDEGLYKIMEIISHYS